jgi:hypothetical protein
MVSRSLDCTGTETSGLMFSFGPSVRLMAGGQTARAGRHKKSRTMQERTETYRIISHLQDGRIIGFYYKAGRRKSQALFWKKRDPA